MKIFGLLLLVAMGVVAEPAYEVSKSTAVPEMTYPSMSVPVEPKAEPLNELTGPAVPVKPRAPECGAGPCPE